MPDPPPPPNSYIVSADPSTSYAFLGVCPRAQTYLAWSVVKDSWILFPLACNTWRCRYCAQTKTKRLAYRVSKATPNRLLTLTVDPKLYATPREAFDRTRKQVPILIRRLRERFGEVEYFRVTEVTGRGWPHYHLLVRSPYLPHAVVKKLWRELTQAEIVDIRQVDRNFRAYTYLLKYLSKMHDLGWTERHTSASKGFFPPEEPFEPEPLELAEGQYFGRHPANFLTEYFQDCEVVRFGDRGFLLEGNSTMVPLPDFEGEAQTSTFRLKTHPQPQLD